MKNIFIVSLFCFIFLNSFSQKIVKERRIALVVGVSNYDHANQLKNTLNDATDLTLKLEYLGFNVIKLLDPKIETIEESVDSIGLKMAKSDIFLFYFSGHGAEYNGENYLFLKNSNPKIPNDMPYETYPIGKLMGRIEFSKMKTNILLLDACRNNPFVRSWTKSATQNEGLANINAPNGTFIGFAASPGKTASDGVRRNGTYTEAILKFIETQNITIDQLFNKINKEVRIQSEGKQIPFKSSSLEDDFYFNKDIAFNIFEKDNGSQLSMTTFETARINRPKFPLPKIMKGYRIEALNSYALATLNKTSFSNKELIEISISLLGENIWDKASAIYVEIDKRRTPTNVDYIYGEQFQTSSKNTKIKISSSLNSGTYELTCGFYLVNELNQEYPPFYSKKFSITIF